MKPVVLVVDDEAAIRELVARQLREQCSVVTAGDALSALGILRERPVDVVLSDWRMPRIDGIELLETLARHGHGARRVLFSASRPDTLDALVAEGVVEVFLPKPFSTSSVRALVGQLVDAHGP